MKDRDARKTFINDLKMCNAYLKKKGYALKIDDKKGKVIKK
jgi:hypothetical protein